MDERIRIAVVDDHPIFRNGVSQTFRDSEDLELVATGASHQEAVEIARRATTDIILLDIQLPGGGLEAVRSITEMESAPKVVMLTASDDESNVLAALEAGASGYILKGVSANELIGAVRSIQGGETYVTPALAARMLRGIHKRPAPGAAESSVFVLTPREETILDCVAVGRTNKEIAIELSISEKTVKHYMTTIMHKLQVRNRVEAALKARQRKAATEQRGGIRSWARAFTR